MPLECGPVIANVKDYNLDDRFFEIVTNLGWFLFAIYVNTVEKLLQICLLHVVKIWYCMCVVTIIYEYTLCGQSHTARFT